MAGWPAGPASRGVMSRAASAGALVAAARAHGVSDERVLEAISVTPRAGYVPGGYLTAAGRDVPVPIGHGQVTTQPSLSARMIEGLRLAGGDHVLEIGTGRTWPARPGGTLPGTVSATRKCSPVTAAAGCLSAPPTTRSWSRPRSRRSPRRWQRSCGTAAAWCSHRPRRRGGGRAVRAFRGRAAAAASAHPGQVRPAARPLRVPAPALTGPQLSAGPPPAREPSP